MLLYTSLSYDVFDIVVDIIRRVGPLSYYYGWNVTILPEQDQLLLTLMKLKLDLAEQFRISAKTVSNVFCTYVSALHEIFHGAQNTGNTKPTEMQRINAQLI